MHPSSIKLIINALSLTEAERVLKLLKEHESRLDAVIRNRNWGPYDEGTWNNDAAITLYAIAYLEKSIKARTKEVPA